MEAAAAGDDSTCQAIELALSVLESSPKEYLPQYLNRLQNLTKLQKVVFKSIMQYSPMMNCLGKY